MLYAVAVVGTQAQPDSISLSQLYYDRLSHHHNKNHNPPLPRQIMIMTREHSFLVPFAEFDWSLQIWNMMGVVSCAAAQYYAMLQGWLPAARHFTRRALCTGASSSERPAKMISKTQARHHRRKEGKPIKRPRVAT